MDRIVRIGMDTSKSVFQLHGVNESEEPVLRRRLRRSQMVSFISRLPATIIGIEAGGAAHYWARTFAAMAIRSGLWPRSSSSHMSNVERMTLPMLRRSARP